MRKSRGFRFVAAVAAGAVLALTGIGSAVAVTPPSAEIASGPSIQSDQADYTPGSTVVLTGAGWQPGEAVHLHVNDDQGATWAYDSDVVAGDDGTVTDTFNLPNWFVATYRVTATGAESGVVTSAFTDGNLQYTSAGANALLTATAFGTDNCTGTTTGSGNNGSIGLGQPDLSVKLVAPASVSSAGFVNWTANMSFTVISGTDGTQICIKTSDVNATSKASATANYSSSIPTATSVQTGGSPSTYGDSVNFTASVAATGAASPTAGTVSFNDGSTTLCGSVPLGTNSTATCATSALNAGSHTVTASYTPSGNYQASSGQVTQTVNKRTVTGSFTADNKVYDGGTSATIASRSLTNTLDGDTVSLSGGTATFADASVGTAKTVTGTGFTLAGTAAANYVLAGSTLTTTADITKLGLTASFTAADKAYDGNRTAAISAPQLTGVKSGDTVSVSVATGGTGTFASQNAGNGITVGATASSFTLGGASAGDYSITSVNSTTANIAPKHITGSFTTQDKDYDGNASATVTGRSINGVIPGDDVSLAGGTATFPGKDAGTNLDVTFSGGSLIGAAKDNYTLDSVSTTKASIRPLHVTGAFTADNKVYDGNTDAVVHTTSVPGKVSGDSLSLVAGPAVFGSKNVGDNKIVSMSGASLAGDDRADYVLDGVDNTAANITAKTITGSFTAADKPYDSTDSATIASTDLSGVVTPDTVRLDATSATATFATTQVGQGIVVTGTGFALAGADKENYSLASPTLTTTANITKLALTGHVQVSNKTYDGNRSATITEEYVTGLGSDVVELTGGTATFDNKNAGEGKTVTLAGASLTGAAADNYALANAEPTTTATINRKSVDGSFTAENKVYDQNTNATVKDTSLSGVIDGDAVTLTGDASFGTAAAGTHKTVTLSNGTLLGADAGNYTLGTVSDATADITPRDVTVLFSTADKTYDGTAAAGITGSSLQGVLDGDIVSVSGGSAHFDDKNVDTNKPVSASGFVLGGSEGDNYQVGHVQDTTANITPLGITGSFASANRVYDAGTSAAATDRAVTGAVEGDEVSLTGGTATFADKNVGNGKTVTLTGADLTGKDAGNYTLDSVRTTKADITALGITGSFTADNKVYDGNATANVLTRSLTGVLTGDTASLSGGTASFADKNVGTAKTVTLTGAGLSGTDAGNYTLDSVGTATADISKRDVTITFGADDKVYDGGTQAVINGAIANSLENDDVNVDYSQATAEFGNKDVGEDKSVTADASGFELTGKDSGNYTIKTAAPTNATITAKPISGSFTADNKVYDGTRNATVIAQSPDSVITGDAVSLTGGTATFDTRNVGTGKTVTLTGAGLSGTDAGNYTLTSVDTTKADISALGVTASFTADSKVYDGNATANVLTRSLSGTIKGDEVSLTGGTATFADKNVDTGKTVTLTGAGLSGTDAGNYTILNAQPTTTADITPLGVTGSFKSANKIYDSGTAAAATERALTGTIDGDNVSLTGGTATFADKNVGTAKTVTLTGAGLSGTDAGNYTLGSVGTTTADITPATLTGSFTAENKVYDGNTGVTIDSRSLSGVLGLDKVSLTGGTATFDDKNVGTAKTVTGKLADFALSGNDAGNYTLASVGGTKADITPRPVTITANNATKILGAPLPNFTGQTDGNVVQGETLNLTFATTATSASPAGSYDIVPSVAADSVDVAKNYAITPVNGKLSILYARDGFLQPVNDTAHQVGPISVFNAGQTIPLKFQLKNASGQVVQATVSPKALAPVCLGKSNLAVNETATATAATSGSDYVWDGSQYQYNWKTTKAMAGSYWQVGALLDDGTTQTVIISLR